MDVQKNESDGTLRRLKFYLVDATDGITPETGEAGGQPQISMDGAAWTSSGVGVLVSQGSGHYYAEVTQATINIDSGIIDGRYKSANTAEAPSLNFLRIVSWDPQTQPSVNTTKLDAVLAQQSTVSANVTDLIGLVNSIRGTDFEASRDSLSKIRRMVADVMGSAYNSGEDSLHVIAGQLASLIPIIGGSTGGGSSAFSLSTATGVVARMIRRVRMKIDEPETNAKYPNADVFEEISDAYKLVMGELNRVSKNLIPVRFSISVVSGTQEYVIPPTIGRVKRFAEIDSTTGNVISEVVPRDELNPSGPGFTIEGTILRFTPIPTFNRTLEISYIPNGDVAPVVVKALPLASGTNAMTLLATADEGTLDLRENAYAGYIVRLTDARWTAGSDDLVQERPVLSFDPQNRRLTWRGDLDPFVANVSEQITVEIIPRYLREVESVVCSVAAGELALNESNNKRYQAMMEQYRKKMRDLRLDLSQEDGRRGRRFVKDTVGNPMLRRRRV